MSGFLISWAIRRATSRQAAMRCIFSSSVRLSKTSTKPSGSPSSFSRRVKVTRSEKFFLKTESLRCWRTEVFPVIFSSFMNPSMMLACSGGSTSEYLRLIKKSLPILSNFSAKRLIVVILPSPSREITPASTFCRIISV